MKNNSIFSLKKVIFFSGLSLLLGMFKFSSLMGFQLFHLSAAEIFGPLVGLYGGLACALAVASLRIGIKAFLLQPAHSLTILSLKIPTLCAAAYWAKDSFVTRALVPALCILAFNMHSVGQEAWLYSCYWLIPLVIYYSPVQKNIFAQSLASTFIAHGVGSVLWLYCTPMTAHMFISLIPVVFVERFILAFGTALVVLAVQYAVALKKSFFTQSIA